jgi:hypothetical protein
MYLLDDDLTTLRPEDLQRVCRWAEDRLINAVTPLVIRLQDQKPPGGLQRDQVLLAAQRAVNQVLAAVEEVRWMAGEATLCAKDGLSAAMPVMSSARGVRSFTAELPQLLPD